MSAYSELEGIVARAKSGDTDACIDLAMMCRNTFAHISFAEATRLTHALIFKAIALQLSQGFKPLLQREPSVASTVNRYKDEPTMQNLHGVLELLISVGQRYGEEVLTAVSIVINRSFQKAADELENLIEKAMRKTSCDMFLSNTVRPFKSDPSFRTFVETVKKLNAHYKEYCDDDRCRELLLHAVCHGNKRAVALMSQYYDEPAAELKPDRRLNESLLGESFVFATIWDKSTKYQSFPL